MELIKLSKFKNQLRTLITEFHDLSEREKSSNEQISLHIQKQQLTEERFGREVQELKAKLAVSNENLQKLERKNENVLLENKYKDVKATMDSLLTSRENFENAYQDSTCAMKRSIEIKDRKITILSEKINSHILLFESIEKEAFSVKQVVDSVQRIVSEKEDVVAGLKSKMDTVSSLEKLFAEKTLDLETKLQKYGDELRKKNTIISVLEAQVETAKTSTSKVQPQIEELQRTLSAKELMIQNLISDKKALHFELGTLGFILQKIRDTVVLLNEEDKQVFSQMLEIQEGIVMAKEEDNSRVDEVRRSRENSPSKGCDRGPTEITASSMNHDQNSVGNHLQENNNFSSCMVDSTCVDAQMAANDRSVSVNEAKDDNMETTYQLDSECSTSQVETPEHPV